MTCSDNLKESCTLENFQKNIVGSKGKISDFKELIASKGDFSRISDLEVILNSWSNILMTPLRTYQYNPNYGSELYKFVFEPADEDTVERIKEEVKFRLLTFDDRASILGINVLFGIGGKSFVVNIDVKYKGQLDQLSLTFDQSTYLSVLE